MRHDVPAALPLIALIAGLAGVWPVAALALALCFRRRAVTVILFYAAGAWLAHGVATRPLPPVSDQRFVTIAAPMERDWAARDDSFVLRANEFTIGGTRYREPLSIYARFTPPAMEMEATIRAEGFLRRSENGDYALTVKSSLLMSYHGRLHGPAAWNRALANRLRPHIAKHPVEVALVEALVLGRGELLTRDVRDSFKRGGTYHLLVFSGLQIAVAAAALAALLRWLHAPRASDWLLLSFAVLAPLFIGVTASVSRASIGIGLYALSRILKRPTTFANLWCVAALLRLLIEPRDLTDASFHLTYAGAGALIFLAQNGRWSTRALAAELAITPLTLFHFHQFALGGSLVTIAMSPVIFAMLIVSALACAVPCDAVFATIALLHRLCGAMNVFAWSGWFTAPPLLAMIAGYGAAFVWSAVAQPPLSKAAAMPPHSKLFLLIPTLAAILTYANARTVETPRILFLDVGQGDAIALRWRDHAILVDGGPVDARLLPLLVDRGIRHLDAVVLTHAHPDHCAGLPAVIEQLGTREVWISPRRFRGGCATRILDACLRTHTPVRILRDEQSFAEGELRFESHLPPLTFRRSSENNASVVLRVTARKRTILLTGDIEREAELWLADRDLRADVLKVAHHGSRSSTSETWLNVVRPRLAFISCGRRNLFGHPHDSVLAALSEHRVRTWRTDRGGTLELEVRDGHLFVRPQFDTLN